MILFFFELFWWFICRLSVYSAVYSIVIAVIVLFWDTDHLNVEILVGFLYGRKKRGIHGLRSFSVWMSWKTKSAHHGLLLLGLQVIIHFCPSGLYMERYNWKPFILSNLVFPVNEVPYVVYNFNSFRIFFFFAVRQWQWWFIRWNLSYILFVGDIYWPLHCQLRSGEVDRVSFNALLEIMTNKIFLLYVDLM